MESIQYLVYALLVQHFFIALLIGQLAGQIVGKKKFLRDKLKQMQLKVNNDHLLKEHISIGSFIHIIFSSIEILLKGGMNKEGRDIKYKDLSRYVVGKQNELRDSLLEDYVVEEGKNPFLHILESYIDEFRENTAMEVDYENKSHLVFSNVDHGKALAELCIELLRNIHYVSDAMEIKIRLIEDQGILQVHLSFTGSIFSFIDERINPIEDDDDDDEDSVHPDELEYGYNILEYGYDILDVTPVRYLGLDNIDKRLEELQTTMTHSYDGSTNYILLQIRL